MGRDPSELRIVHYSVMLPGDSEKDALKRYTPHLWQMMWKYSDMEASATRPGPPPEAPAFTEEHRDSLFGRATLAGPPDQIVSSLLDIRRAAGAPVEFVARSYFPTMGKSDQIGLMQSLAEDIAIHI